MTDDSSGHFCMSNKYKRESSGVCGTHGMGGLYGHYVRHGLADDSDRLCQKSKGGGTMGQKVARRPISQVIWDPYTG